MARKKLPLTDAEWRTVFNIRCRAKRGEYLSPEDTKLIERAFREDAERYKAMGDEVFNATKPFGAK